jgi:hypothetical protein
MLQLEVKIGCTSVAKEMVSVSHTGDWCVQAATLRSSGIVKSKSGFFIANRENIKK